MSGAEVVAGDTESTTQLEGESDGRRERRSRGDTSVQTEGVDQETATQALGRKPSGVVLLAAPTLTA